MRRAGVYLRMANSPAGSWQQLALIAHHHMKTAWFVAASADLARVLPNVRLRPTMVHTMPHLSSSSHWTDEGEWSSFLAFALPVNMAGLRYRPAEPPGPSAFHKSVRGHISRILHILRIDLRREHWSEVYRQVQQAASDTAVSKYFLLATRLQHPGPPLHIALDRIALPSHRAALASWFCCDWFLAVFANNYYGRNLTPQTRSQRDRALDAGCTDNNVCLACWHFRRQAFVENEYHILCVCPEYEAARQDFVTESGALNTLPEMFTALSCKTTADAESLGKLLARMRQRRRRLKITLERHNDQVASKGFAVKRAAWKLKRRPSCRHGVLFSSLPDGGCKCMPTPSTLPADWQQAKFMPALDHDLKIIVAVPFQRDSYIKLNTLQHTARSLGW